VVVCGAGRFLLGNGRRQLPLLDVTVRVSRRELTLTTDSLWLNLLALGRLHQLVCQQACSAPFQTMGVKHTRPRLSWLFSVCAGIAAASGWRACECGAVEATGDQCWRVLSRVAGCGSHDGSRWRRLWMGRAAARPLRRGWLETLQADERTKSNNAGQLPRPICGPLSVRVYQRPSPAARKGSDD
jgi:hypothetical protein